ncbi:hypothetical protein HPB47_010170 [Ixodes persulcatus]|uniref:Uncharacterized protein n=1 Tax=Ixodes persulcatus TaxID=34615 RepID=A0AC60NZW1_IXOPE|nr:hypothetical protein HPB47_010170 [Ixodes persulcatus]
MEMNGQNGTSVKCPRHPRTKDLKERTTRRASTPPCVTPDNGASSTRRGKDGKEVAWKTRGESKEGGEERMTTQRALSLETKRSVIKDVVAKNNVADTTVATVWKSREQKRDCLPVLYTANGKAWMTQELFASCLKSFYEAEVTEKRHVVLILDNCMDLRGAIDMITASWWQVKATTIQKCLRNAGFLRDAGNSEDFHWRRDAIDAAIGTDDVVENHFEATTDEAIVAAVRGSEASPPEDEADDDEESTPEVSSKDALEFLQKLKDRMGPFCRARERAGAIPVAPHHGANSP